MSNIAAPTQETREGRANLLFNGHSLGSLRRNEPQGSKGRPAVRADARESQGRGGGRRRLRPAKNGGARRIRTDDILLAKQALSQLSYGPVTQGRSAPRGPKGAEGKRDRASALMRGKAKAAQAAAGV